MNPAMFAMFAIVAARQGRDRQALAQTLPLAMLPGSPVARVAFGALVARNFADEQRRTNNEIADALERAAPAAGPRITEAQVSAMPRILEALTEVPAPRRALIVKP